MMSLKWSGFIFCKQVADAAAFELKDALGLAALQEGKRLLVVERELVRIDALAGRLLDQIDGLGEDRQVPQAEKIHLQEARRLDVAHRPLRDDVGLVLHAAERHVFGQRLVGDHDGRGVRADVAGQPFDLAGQVEHFAGFGVGVIDPLQLVARFQRFVERDAELLGHQGLELR